MDALARARLADDAEGFPFIEFIGNSVDGVDDAFLRMETCDEVFDLHHNGLCQVDCLLRKPTSGNFFNKVGLLCLILWILQKING